MTRQLTRLNDLSQGHSCFPSRICDTASPNVYTNSIPNHRQGDHWVTHCCFTGETKIKLIGGKDIAIKNLVNNYKGKRVYSCRDNGKVIYGEVINAFVTKRTRILAEIELSNGNFFQCTPEHLIMLCTGEYKQAFELEVNADELMPFTDVKTPIVVKSIELSTFDEEIPVYDLTIKNSNNTHNFALSAGIFVHNCGSECHDGFLLTGSQTVYTNGLQQSRQNDPISCGDSVMTGSPNVFVGPL